MHQIHLVQRHKKVNIDVCETLMPPFPNMTFDLDLWPTDLKINRDHLLIKDYLPTKFEASGAKPSWVISCTRLRETDIPTDMCNAICPSFFKGGHNNLRTSEYVWRKCETSRVLGISHILANSAYVQIRCCQLPAQVSDSTLDDWLDQHWLPGYQ